MRLVGIRTTWGQQLVSIAVPAWSDLELSVSLLLLQVSLNYLADLHQMHEEWITQGQKPGSFSSDMVRRNADCCWRRLMPAQQLSSVTATRLSAPTGLTH